MDIVICAIAKNEHLYINDWIRYHFSIGFNHIYLFDNDDPGALFIGDVISPEYRDRVTIFNVRGIRKQWFQQECYNAFYQKYNKTFDWCAFVDIDEYVVVNAWNDVPEMLNDPVFNTCNSIKLHWHMYGDNDCIKRDLKIPVYDFFKKRIIKPNDRLWLQGKQITRGGIVNANIHNHNCFINGQIIGQVTADGTPCFEENNAIDVYGRVSTRAFINHYMTKTLDEFLNQKFNRTDAMFERRNLGINYFWILNEQTPEKLQYIAEWLKSKKV